MNCCSFTRFTSFEFFSGKSTLKRTLKDVQKIDNVKSKYCCWQCISYDSQLVGICNIVERMPWLGTLVKPSERVRLGTKPKCRSHSVEVWHCGLLLSIKYDLISSSGHYQYCINSWLSYWKRFSQNHGHYLHSTLSLVFSPHFFLIIFAVSLSAICTALCQTSLSVCFSTDTSRSIPTTGTDKNPQTEGLQLPERDKRRTAEQESAAADSSGRWERAAHTHTCSTQQQQQQPTSSEPQTVISVISEIFWSQENRRSAYSIFHLQENKNQLQKKKQQ